MSKSFKFRAAVTAVGLAAGALMAGSAQAYTYAVSSLQIKDLALTISNINDSISSYSFNIGADAQLGSTAPAQSASQASCSTVAPCVNTIPTLNTTVANAAGGTLVRGENNFGFLGTTGLAAGKTYATADSQITSSELVTFPKTTTVTKQIAEALLNTDDTATANSKVGSQTGLVFTIPITIPGSIVKLVFKADADMKVDNTNPSFNNSSADMSAVFTLTKTGAGNAGKSVSWSPVGTAANDCVVSSAFTGVKCAETADGESLNQTLGSDVTPDTVTNSSFNTAADWSDFGITIKNLPIGTYTIKFAATTGVQLERAADVPEPGSLALIGVALAGLGYTARRRKA